MNDSQPAARAARLRARLREPLTLAALAALLAAALLARVCGGDAAPVYETEAARRGELVVSVTATGTLQPINQVDIGSELSGTMRSVEVDFNDPVRRGQVIARLDTTRLDAQVLQSEAALAAANAHIELAEASRLEAEAQLERLEHVREISGGKVPSTSELDTARAMLARAKAEVASARASSAQARATLDAQRTDLAKAVIRSPIDGIVLKRAIEPGQTVAASLQAPILFTLAEDLTHMELLVAVDEADVSAVAEKQSATFSVDAWPGLRFEAEVVQVRYGADAMEGVVTYGALLRVDNPERRLRPGMTATAEITVKRIANALLVPNAALRFAPPDREAERSGGLLRALLPGRPPFARPGRETQGGVAAPQRVYRMQGEEPEPVEVEIGASDGTWTELAHGEIAAGDALVVAAQTPPP
jgi:HlyD family secretion protein